jgi:hydrogenase/urease accessory protein HupE
MKNALRGAALASMALAFGAPALWAHPGHVTDGGLWHTLTHLVTSPYHMAVIGGVGVLGAAWTVALRARRQRVGREAEVRARD